MPPMPCRPVRAGCLGRQVGEDLVGGAAGAVDPVVQDDDPFRVVVAGLGRVVDDQRPVQAAVELHPGVRVIEVRARIRGGELVGEASRRRRSGPG